MSLSDDITCISNILMTLLQSSLGVIVVTERMRHASVALHCHHVACCLQELGVLVGLVPAKIVLCSDDVRSRHAFERLCEYRGCHPVVERSLSELCMHRQPECASDVPSPATHLCL